jgi:hypothetical protein
MKQKLVIAAEVRPLRPVKGCTRIGRFRNEDVRHELNVTSVTQYIERYRERWGEHLETMDLNRLPAISYRYRSKGRRDVGRPRKRWSK